MVISGGIQELLPQRVPCPRLCLGMREERRSHMPRQSRGHDTLVPGKQVALFSILKIVTSRKVKLILVRLLTLSDGNSR